MMQDLEVGLHEFWIGNVEIDRLLRGGINAQRLRHRGVLLFVRIDAVGGMQIQRGAQALLVQPRDEALPDQETDRDSTCSPSSRWNRCRCR